ncbi:MAG: hypothetical protein COB98_07985 [Flavobacteriaceae bacterium]|nr:MAG: hypothetical protein COB98_07985 [Flavobacteriaceae bacterium]
MQSQAKKPSIMVIPSDNWCQIEGFMTSYDNLGTVKNVPDYRKALQNSYDLNSVISKVGELMADRGFPLVDLERILKKIELDQARQSMKMSENSGASLSETPMDILKRVAKADIIINLSWKVNTTGPKKSISFNMQGLDAYTGKQVTAASGTGTPSFTADVVVLLEEAVISYLDKFNEGLMNHFEDLFENGREGALVIQVWDDSEVNLESEFELKGRTAELKRIIGSYWMPRNTLKGRFSQDESSAYIQKFSQVRIPLYGDDGWGGEMALDFNSWGVQLVDFLKNEFSIVSKIEPVGLGEVHLTIGNK